MQRRKQPFSHKQKKLQLQEKRARKHAETHPHSSTTHSPSTTDDTDPSLSETPKLQPSTTKRGDLTSVFRKIQGAKVEAGKSKSREPIIKVPMSSSRVRTQEVYPDDRIIGLPVRPMWTYDMTKEEVEENEERMFERWMKNVDASYCEGLSLYERNLERQLWRTVELSDILIIVVDIRHPIIHFPPSLYRYITRTIQKPVAIVFTKVDLVPSDVLDAWKGYFRNEYPDVKQSCVSCYPREYFVRDEEVEKGVRRRRKRSKYAQASGAVNVLKMCQGIQTGKGNVDWVEAIRKVREVHIEEEMEEEGEDDEEENNDDECESHIVEDVKGDKSVLTIGFIGHPNVGKSSLINSLVGKKVVSVSKTPGHTKHLQTIHITKDLRLCDCPGLVFPALIPRELQILMGMLKIAQVQEPYTIVKYLAERVDLPSILRLKPTEGISAWDICEQYAVQRGFLTARAARPDVYRAANQILRMTADGNILLYFQPPSETTIFLEADELGTKLKHYV